VLPRGLGADLLRSILLPGRAAVKRAVLGWVCAATLASLGCNGCGCGDNPLGPLEDPKPADLGAQGIFIEQPNEGDSLTGQWVAVTGWLDPAKYDFVLVTGAPRAGFYSPTGHIGLGTVPVMLRDDGRFIAPRVPLADGNTELRLIAFSKDVAAADLKRNVTATGTSDAPATLVVEPPGGAPPLTVKLSAHAATRAADWQWDFEGDARFDEQAATTTHTYAEGTHVVVARTRVDGRMVYALSPVMVNAPGTSGATGVVGPEPLKVVVVPVASSDLPPDETSGTRYVLVAEPDRVRVLDGQLHELASLTGLQNPNGMAADAQGRIYVSDTGHDRIVRYTPQWALDSTFGDGGTFTGPDGDALKAPGALSLHEELEVLEDGGVSYSGKWNLVVLEQGGRQLSFSDVSFWGQNLHPFSLPLDSTLKPSDFVRSIGPLARPMDAWFLAGGTLYMPGLSHPTEAPAVTGLRAFTAASDLSSPYWAALDGSGDLHEWFMSKGNHRFTDLGFDARALAVDPEATRFLEAKRRESGDDDTWTFGPAVLIIAGPNHIERYTVPAFVGGTPW
jgi:hypothetical protein